MMYVSYVPHFIASLLLLTGLSPTNGATLFPFGPENGDIEYVGVEDGDAMTVLLGQPFIFAGEMKTHLSIADNGNINFDDSSSANGDFPSDKDRIAVLWEDLDPDPGGKIFYRETTDSSVLMDAGQHVKEILGVHDFRPSWAFLTTWKDYNRFNVGSDLDFQIVIVANGSHSYALLVYCRMEISDPAELMDATIGVNAGESGAYVELCPDEFDELVAIVHKKQSQCQSWPGILAFRVDEIENLPCVQTLPDPGPSGCNAGGCTDSRCPLCNTKTGNCVECIECDDNGNCTTPERPSCDTGTGCCFCLTHDDCTNSRRPLCDLDGICKECLTVDDCTNPSRTCTADGLCEECSDDFDCIGDSKGPECDLETHKCVCRLNTHCDGGRICNPDEKQCVCPLDNTPCTGHGKACDASGRCGCSDAYVSDEDGNCNLNCDPPCAADETCTVERKCARGCVDPGSDVCPSGKKKFMLRACAKYGQLGGYCKNGKCFEKNVSCNRRLNICMCRGRCNAEVVCNNRH